MDLKIIPGTDGYMASRCGRIFDSEGVEKNYYVNLDGYITVNVRMLDGSMPTFGVHRMVAMAHLPWDRDVSQLTVNHIDGDCTNNDVENLEWTTVKVNNIHAALFKSESRPRILADKDGVCMFLRDLFHAGEHFGYQPEVIWKHIKEGIPIDGWVLTHHGTKDRIPEQLHKARIRERDSLGQQPSRPVLCLDIQTNEVQEYPSMGLLGRAIDALPSHIFQCMSRGDVLRLVNKRYVCAYKEEGLPEIDQESLDRALGRGPKEVLAKNVVTGEVSVFKSASLFHTTQGLSKKAVTTTLKKDVIRQVGPWAFVYNTPWALGRLNQFTTSPVV